MLPPDNSTQGCTVTDVEILRPRTLVMFDLPKRSHVLVKALKLGKLLKLPILFIISYLCWSVALRVTGVLG